MENDAGRSGILRGAGLIAAAAALPAAVFGLEILGGDWAPVAVLARTLAYGLSFPLAVIGCVRLAGGLAVRVLYRRGIEVDLDLHGRPG